VGGLIQGIFMKHLSVKRRRYLERRINYLALIDQNGENHYKIMVLADMLNDRETETFINVDIN